MRYLHTMLRVRNLDVALKFYVDAFGLKEVRRIENDKGRFTLVFLCSADDLEALKKQPQTRGAPLVEPHLELGRGEIWRGPLLRPSRL